MRILIDIVHPADVNFYRNAVDEMVRKGHSITFAVFRRGKRPSIVENEYPEFERILLGRHRHSLLGKIFGILTREIGFFRLYLKRKFDVVTSFGFYPGMLAPFFGIKAVHFHDDKEYRLNYFLTRFFSTRFISLCDTDVCDKAKAVNSYKELAYLAPGRIKEDTRFFSKYGLRKEKFVYVRDISHISLNYKLCKPLDYHDFFHYLVAKGYKILYDSEDGKSRYDHVTLLREPLTFKQMIALKKYAKLVITSGDTVLREAALLGTPAIYTNSREMSINHKLHKAGLFDVALTSEDLIKKGEKLLKPGHKQEHQKKAAGFVRTCEDMTSVIIRELTKWK